MLADARLFLSLQVLVFAAYWCTHCTGCRHLAHLQDPLLLHHSLTQAIASVGLAGKGEGRATHFVSSLFRIHTGSECDLFRSPQLMTSVVKKIIFHGRHMISNQI